MKGYKILIIDDDESTHEVLGRYLRLSGFQVLNAYDGAKGLQVAGENKPDLILLDVQMPEIDGFQSLKILKEDKELGDTQVLMLTSLDRPNLRIKGLELGAEDYIVKPFHRAELLARINAAIRRASRFKKVSNSFGGKLEDISLPELLQTMEIGKKTVCIDLVELEATLGIEEGTIVNVRFRDFVGRGALRRIFYLESGGFSLKFNELPDGIERTPMPVQGTMMDSVTYIDELRKILGKVGNDDTIIEIKPGCTITELNPFADGAGRHVKEVVVSMPGDLKENAEKLVEALDSGDLVVNG